MQEVTQLTQVTLLTNSTKHKPSNLKQVMQKNGSHEVPEFLLEKFRNFGTWGKTEFPEIRKSEFPELQSLDPRAPRGRLVHPADLELATVLTRGALQCKTGRDRSRHLRL